MNLEWDIPFSLVTSQGTLALNATTGNRYVIDASKSAQRLPKRIVTDNMPQAPGEIFHRRYDAAFQMTLSVQLAINTGGADLPACDSDLVDMIDALMLHLQAMENDPDARIVWSPTGHANRMMHFVHLVEVADPALESNAFWSISFTVESPLPYAIDETQQLIFLDAVITNIGTTEFWPVIKVAGPTTGFVLSNNTTGLLINYDSAQPGAQAIGGGDYAEIDCFRNTIYLNGNGANLLPGVVQADSDFFSIVPGANGITLSGGSGGAVLYNNPWT